MLFPLVVLVSPLLRRPAHEGLRVEEDVCLSSEGEANLLVFRDLRRVCDRRRVTLGSSSSTPDLFFNISSSISGRVGRWRVNVTFAWRLVGSASRRRLPGGSVWALHKGVSRASDPVACRVFGYDYGVCAS
ncbi:hypothetical protein Rs2_41270 [Raphanus sativus]|nr:hypothetical protein Rs2_41270 [Raphanus sativus]